MYSHQDLFIRDQVSSPIVDPWEAVCPPVAVVARDEGVPQVDEEPGHVSIATGMTRSDQSGDLSMVQISPDTVL